MPVVRKHTLEVFMLIFGLAAWSCSPGHGAAVPPAQTDLPAGEQTEAELVVAGGCFWCVEGVFEQLEGVSDVVSGYAGGDAGTAQYELVAAGRTEHAEVVKITYNPQQISYATLLQVFFSTHNPTELNRQGPDVGKQYRSAVFVASDEERAVVRAYIDQINNSDAFGKDLATTIEPLTAFYPAEGYHQDYVRLNPNNGYVRYNALPKIDKVRALFPDRTDGKE